MTCAGKTVKTTCPYCGVGCGILATPHSDGSVDIKGDPDHPANFGRLCSKGSALGETTDLEGRLLYPEVYGKRKSWDQTLDLVASEFSSTIAEHEPNSVAFYVSGQILTEDYYVANKLMKGFIGSANIDTNSRLCMASSVVGHRRAFGTDTVPGVYEDLELADLVILTGSNLAWCHPVLYQRIAAAKESRPEMKVVLIDPRRTMTADLADVHLAIKPDGDTALFAGLLAYLSQQDALDYEYINQFTNGFQDALSLAGRLSADELVHQTGLSQKQLEAFYQLFEKTEKTVTLYSQGVNQSSVGSDKVNAIINCHLATGRIGKPGMGPFSATGQPNAMGGREVGGLANMLACHMDIEREDHRDLVQSFWQSPKMPTKLGLKAVDLFKAVDEGKIKAIWIMSTNPVDSLPDADFVAQALEKCPFVVVSDIIENTDTMRYAHVKLPATGWGEKNGTVTNSERRISHQRQFLQWPGDAKPDWWQLTEVARRMGFCKSFEYETPADIFREYAALSAYENNDARDFDIGECASWSGDEYNNFEPFQWPYVKGSAPKETRFFAKGNFYTPDRKARFIAVESARPERTNKQYLLILNTGRVRDHWHTMTRTAKSKRLSSHMAEPYCEIHPADAARLGVETASLVNVETDKSSIIVRALISLRQQEGSVFVPMHWTDEYASNGRVDKLVPSVVDPFSGQPASKNTAVNVSCATVQIYGFAVFAAKPHKPDFKYWALAKCDGGWRLEFALDVEENIPANLQTSMGIKQDEIPVSYEDKATGQNRFAWFENNKLKAAVFLAPEPVQVSRQWACDQLTKIHRDPLSRYKIVAARADAGKPDKGAIVCSCFSVGSNEIASAIREGCCTVSDIGKKLNAGTNCGSCRAEISGLIDEHHLIAAE